MSKITIKKNLYIIFTLAPLMLLGACDNTEHNYQGYIEGDYTYISAPVSGKLVALNVSRGQEVKKHTILARLENEPEYFSLDESMAQTRNAQYQLSNMTLPKRKEIINELLARQKQAQAELTLANERLKRSHNLYIKKVLDKDSYDAAVAKATSLKALINQYKAQIAEARLPIGREHAIKAQEFQVIARENAQKKALWFLNKKTLKAPYHARVVDIFYRIGELTAAQRPIMSLLKESNKHLIFFIPEPKLNSLKLNQKIHISCDGCKKQLSASVSYISSNAEYTPPLVYSREHNSKLVFKVRARLDEPKSLHPGQPVTVFIGQ